MADIKSLLKEARKLVDEKNFKDAQECCKNILRKDKQNYLALVLLGKSLQDADQAPLAYQKAIASKPDHALAWQGLANFYERKEDNASKIKLISIYNEILKLSLEEEKALEIITKVGQLGCSLKNNDTITILLSYIKSKPENKLKETAEEQLLILLKSDIICKENDISSVLSFLDCMENNRETMQMIYAKIILQKPNFASAVTDIINLSFFSTNVSLREWLCKQLCFKFVEENSFMGFDIDEHFNLITEGIENSKYPALLKSMIYYNKGQYLEAYKQCVPLVNYQEADKTEAIFIIRCTLKLNKWSIAQKLATNFLIKVKDDDCILILKKLLFASLYEQQKWVQAISISKDIPVYSFSESEQAALAKCYIETNQEAAEILDNLQSTKYFAQLRALSLMKTGKYNDAVAILEENSLDNQLNLFYLGQCYWELQQYDKCLLNLLKSAKLNAEHGYTFLYLGHFYYKYKQDLEKAKKCYEKAHSLNNTDKDIIKSLSESYLKLNLKDLDFELLKAYHNKENETWIHFRLGLHYINKREWEDAILQFRNVIKANKNDVIAFECLADAYYSRGSFTSALKAYKRVIALNSNHMSHCLTRIGFIHCLLTEYEDAITTFENVLKMDAKSVLALKGIAETWIKIAKKKASAKLFGAARDSAQNAINFICKALTQEKRFTCFWNLLANALIFITNLPDKYCYVYMRTASLDQGDMVKVDKLNIFPQALACYSKVIKINKQNSSYILALTYLLYYHASGNISNLQISYKLALACIHSKPSAWRNWNLLGKICVFMKKYDIAQHCFIKALLVTHKWSVAKIWCNLGSLYVIVKLYKLANYCFWRGQSTLPSYPQSWIGQALIAEVIREEEAMDLYRHASRLGYHPESALGYADWICRILKNGDYKNNRELKYVIDDLYAVTYGIDLMEWFITHEPNNACALNILAILQERSGLLHVALESYQKGLEFAEEEKKNIIRLNIGRLLNRLERYDDAIITYKNVTEASLDSTCGLALALFKKGLYEEAYSAYDTALHWLSNDDDEKSDLLVAMAGIVYMFKGMDDAKTLLFHSIQVSQKKPTPYSLFAICSLGILHSDQSLSKLALSELQKYEMDSRFGYDIGFLKSYLIYISDIDLAIKSISDSIHDHPSDALLWFCMSQYCLQSPSNKAKVASCCAQRAMYSDHDNSLTAKMMATASVAENVSGDKLKAMLLAKKGLHLYPSQPEVWAAILFSITCQKINLEKRDWTLAAANHMRRQLDVSRQMIRWITLLEKKLTKA
ncbi:tetratricopeptide repeat protein 37 [Zerene cesonia]|uniref:tetratricopeptide repeat protein 37 n=1 Tax=Zerene cesonia TaxID=33412 RepID=UPI0018E4FF8F|nr:tetratricopeptide repeat protein 37 [Zerene cesonia]XP_038215402.1 tetratricopeptide repeat protein 37 [Zerene cesonia]